MADDAYAGEEHGLKAKLADLTGGARDMAHGALTEAMAWTAYQWTVLALLTAIFVLIALSYGGIRTELAALKQERAPPGDGPARSESQLEQQMSDLKAALTQSITGLDDKITKIGAKLETRNAAKPAAPLKPTAPPPKPAARPKPQ
jgi:hypothetical protein